MAELDRVREALRASMTAWATLEVRGDQARVIMAPDPDALTALLDRIDPAWGISWGCDHLTPPVVRARLSVGGVSREGLAQAQTLQDAKLAALAEAARMFGVGSPSDGQWVEYDAEDGANTAHLEVDTAPEGPVSTPALPPEPPRDPQMEKARRHIEELIEQLKAAGKGGSAARIILRGYGETLEESRAIYKELQGLLRG